MTIAHRTVDALRAAGIDTLFCLPGVQNDPFFDALVDAPDIRPIVARHEQGTSYMAMGASQVTGAPSACAVVPGPGLLNAGGGLTSAYWAGGRVLTISGAVPAALIGKHTGVLHDLPDQGAVFDQVTKSRVVLDDGATAVASLQRALDDLVSGVPRPVGVEVPADCWSAPADGSLVAPTAGRPDVGAAPIDQVADLLARAEQPLVVVGGGAYDASAEITALVERLGCPVFTRRQGLGIVPGAHRLSCPMPVGREFWKTADVVVAFGTRLEFPLHWGTDDDMTVVMVNVDETELDRHGLGFLGVHADCADAAAALFTALEGRSLSSSDQSALVAERRAAFDRDTAHLEPQRSILAAIDGVMPDDGVLVEDVTQIGFAAHIMYDHRAPRQFLTTGAAGTLGAAVPHAIGAQVGAPDRPVVGIIGDGGFGFSAMEMATAVQHDIPVTWVVFEDGAYGNVKRIQSETFGADRTIASTLRNPDFVAMGKAFDVHSVGVDTPEGLATELGAAIDRDAPSLIVMSVPDMPNPWPWLRMGTVRS